MIDANEANGLFREYRRTGDKNIRNRLVENYIYIAEILAKKFAGRGVEYDDLFQVASEALIGGGEIRPRFGQPLYHVHNPHNNRHYQKLFL